MGFLCRTNISLSLPPCFAVSLPSSLCDSPLSDYSHVKECGLPWRSVTSCLKRSVNQFGCLRVWGRSHGFAEKGQNSQIFCTTTSGRRGLSLCFLFQHADLIRDIKILTGLQRGLTSTSTRPSCQTQTANLTTAGEKAEVRREEAR